ncbi:MAG: GtrA family protein [Verrucomicrobia bacterium]|nr:MAG: GtrA family protein [Verrucomicrobiota bacterium]
MPQWSIQLFRFAIVGLVSNGVLYAAYLLLTHFLVGPKTAMTLLYATGVLQTFVFNRGWTFGHDGTPRIAFIRYVAAYGLGYLLNLASLHLWVDRLGAPHQWVQAAMIPILALVLFALQRYWVFRTPQ